MSDPQLDRHRKPPTKPFLPSRTEVWGFASIVIYIAIRFVPIGIFLFVCWQLPGGDNWPIVVLRLVLGSLAIFLFFIWITFADRAASIVFNGRASDETLDSLFKTETPIQTKPMNGFQAIRSNVGWLIMSVIAFAMAYGLLKFGNLLPVVKGGRRKARALMMMVQWYRDYPNTVISTCLLVGFASIAGFIYKTTQGFLDVATELKNDARNDDS